MRRVLSLLALILPLTLSCLGGDPVKTSTDPPPVEYLPYADADAEVALANLVENLRLAWEAGEIEEYRDGILYDGLELASDGAAYTDFRFYYDPDAFEPDEEVPEPDDFAGELVRVERMFAGEPGSDAENNALPGIRSIALSLQPLGAWRAPDGDSVEGDAFPPGTLERYYQTEFRIELDGTLGEDTTGWSVRDRLRFHVLPVGDGDTLHRFKLWKWRDLHDRGRATVPSSYSWVKSLY